MKAINFRSNILPHVISIALFYVITVLLFSPVIFKNRQLNQHDITQWEGASKELREYRESTGENPVWVDAMFSGMPSYLVNASWNDHVLVYTKIIGSLGLPHPIRNIFLAFVSFYILLLAFKVKPYVAIPFALAFGLTSYMIIGLSAGHNARIGAIAFLPLAFAGIHLTLKGKKWMAGAALTALGVALHLRENHLQITYYLLLISLIYGIALLWEAVKNKETTPFLKRTGILLLAGLLGVATFTGKFWTTLEYSKYSIRGKSELKELLVSEDNKEGMSKSHAFEFSNGIFEPLTLFVPNIFGGSSSNFLVMDNESATYNALVRSQDSKLAQQLQRYSSSYWGNQRLSAPYYVGAVTIFFALMGFLFLDRKQYVWLSIVAVLGIVLSWGDSFSSFNYFMFDYFPGYNKFRSVTFALLLPLFALPLMGALALEKLTQVEWTKELKKKFYYGAGISFGLILLIFMYSMGAGFTKTGEEQLPEFFLNALQKDRMGLLRGDLFRTFIFCAIAGAAIWLMIQKVINKNMAVVVIIILGFIDHFTLDKRYLNDDNFVRKSAASINITDADKAINQDPSDYRVYNILGDGWNESETSNFHQSIGGYHGAKLRRYQELFEYCISEQTNQMYTSLQSGSRDLSFASSVNMLNVKYLKFGQTTNEVLLNENSYGSVWLASQVIEVSSADQELASTCENIDSKKVVVNTTSFPLSNSTFNTDGTIELTDKKPGSLTYSASLNGPSLATFSEIYYPEGWVATIDGKEAPIVQANFVLRALEIPEGTHTIEFKFAPKSYLVGNKITLISSWLVVLLGMFCVVFPFIKKD